MSSLTVSPSPSFLVKNEQSDDLLRPLKIPSFDLSGNPHHLCPVNTTKAYIDATPDVSWDHLFFNPLLGRPLVVRAVLKTLCKIISLVDPGHDPRTHSIHGLVASLTFLHTHSTEEVQAMAGWTSTSSFRSRYLMLDTQDVPCIVLVTQSKAT
ncbi:hypothetical protein Pcinc_019654 [Petrolisthes cinctipes]|uniref:Uncharacterized protein n=1 Tax=Petrolisthes cinctipes TaxID=88211 RepID=A0AAE1FKJ6_PETCI|nr:hypothetical protein Pcinc_019654 [Petrolisthes cinctipes]